ncbi:MAG: uroporphyrinogen-III synthase, partial [Chloroflexi bacterium]|nr:uroporphyrinogen-III synthase [Chloroflexota bacterium]
NELPTIEVEAEDYTALDIAIAHLADYAWVIFTSVNGVEAFFQRLRTLGHDARALKGITLVAIGPATAQALEGFGVRADLIPQDYSAEGILSAISRKKDIKGVKMLLPRAEQVPPKLKDGLIALGAQVEEVAVYRTVPATSSPSAKALFHEGQVDIVTFTSSSTVKNLVAMLDGETVLINRATIACIGPVTAETARKLGLRVDVVAKEHTIAGLVEALKEYLVKARRRS